MIFDFQSCPKIKNFLQILHQFFLLSSTISPYFNSSYYSFFTFFTLYPIFFDISQKNSLLRPIGGGLTAKTPLPMPLVVIMFMRQTYNRTCMHVQSPVILYIMLMHQFCIVLQNYIIRKYRVCTLCHMNLFPALDYSSIFRTSRGVQYVHCAMHNCIMVKVAETKNTESIKTRKFYEIRVEICKSRGEIIIFPKQGKCNSGNFF